MELDPGYPPHLWMLADDGVTPIGTHDFEEWIEWWRKNPNGHIIRQSEVGDTRVSTIFLSCYITFPGRPARLFETMTFHDEKSEGQWRHATRAEAENFHAKLVAELLTAPKAEK